MLRYTVSRYQLSGIIDKRQKSQDKSNEQNKLIQQIAIIDENFHAFFSTAII
jgi:hypothetical protein